MKIKELEESYKRMTEESKKYSEFLNRHGNPDTISAEELAKANTFTLVDVYDMDMNVYAIVEVNGEKRLAVLSSGFFIMAGKNISGVCLGQELLYLSKKFKLPLTVTLVKDEKYPQMYPYIVRVKTGKYITKMPVSVLG